MTMKARYLRLLGLFGIILAVLILSAADRAQVATRKATITFIYGDVQVRHGTAGWQAAKLQDVLNPGDAIKTAASARAEMSIGQGGYVRIDDSSHLLITHLQEDGLTSFKTLVGGVWVTIEKALAGNSKFEVQMPSALASVRGTVFRCTVDEAGDSETFVYDGSVAVTAGGQTDNIAASRFARIGRDKRITLGDIDLDNDDKTDWVQHNRFRDMLRHMGDPKIVVALTDGGEKGRQASLFASAALANTLKRRGFVGASISQQDVTDISFGPNDWVKLSDKIKHNYQIVGRTKVSDIRNINGGKYSARAAGSAYLLPADGRQSLADTTASARGEGDSEEAAVRAALWTVGSRLATDLMPAMMEEMVDRSPGLIRLEILGDLERKQVALVRELIKRVDGVTRVTPLPGTDRRITLNIVGDIQPEALAAIIRKGERVQDVQVAGRVIRVRLKSEQPDARRPQPPQAGERRPRPPTKDSARPPRKTPDKRRQPLRHKLPQK